MSEVTRTVVVGSVRLPRWLFRVFVELEGMYRDMVGRLVAYAVGNGVTSFVKLKALKYLELRSLYPQLPSHYAYTACQDASVRSKSFLKLRKKGLARKDHPEVREVSIWLDDHLWRMSGLTSIELATHIGWVRVELEPHRQYWRYVNSGWRFASEARLRLDGRGRRLIIYLTFRKSVEAYEPRDLVPIDVNENHVAVMIDQEVYLLETSFKDITLGYHYRRKMIQEKYDKLCGVKCKAKRRVLRKLREGERKADLRWKLANIIVRTAVERRSAIVLERLGKNPAKGMISHIKDAQLRHRIYQASFKGVQRAIEEKAREHGVPIVYVNPRNTSRMCPIHKAKIIYENGSRVGRCSKGGELWHREAVACHNLRLKASSHLGDEGDAQSPGGSSLDGSPMPLGSTATHEPTGIPKTLWTRWKSLDKHLGTNGWLIRTGVGLA
jgi:IS605 OrfB family transposase